MNSTLSSLLARVPLAAALLAFLPACNSLTPWERQQYENLIAQGAEPIRPHNPALAGGLNLLPGIGDLYNRQWDAFVVDLLLWYPSVLWAVPQGVVTARNNNARATIAYYSIGPGRDEGFDPNRAQIGP